MRPETGGPHGFCTRSSARQRSRLHELRLPLVRARSFQSTMRSFDGDPLVHRDSTCSCFARQPSLRGTVGTVLVRRRFLRAATSRPSSRPGPSPWRERWQARPSTGNPRQVGCRRHASATSPEEAQRLLSIVDSVGPFRLLSTAPDGYTFGIVHGARTSPGRSWSTSSPPGHDVTAPALGALHDEHLEARCRTAPRSSVLARGAPRDHRRADGGAVTNDAAVHVQGYALPRRCSSTPRSWSCWALSSRTCAASPVRRSTSARPTSSRPASTAASSSTGRSTGPACGPSSR